MPATIEQSTKTKQVFASKCHNLRIVREPEFKEVLATGGQREISPGLDYQFVAGLLNVDDELRARDKRFFERYGEAIGKTDEQPVTEEWLRSHSLDGDYFAEVVLPPPDPSPELEAITDALIAGDAEKLVDIFEDEQNGFGREVVVESSKKALLKLEEDEPPKAA